MDWSSDVCSSCLADGSRRAEDAGGAGDVPAAVVVIGIDGVADAALHFDADTERGQQVAARQRADLRQRQQRRSDGTRRVDDGLQVGVVVVEPVGGYAVQQGSVKRVRSEDRRVGKEGVRTCWFRWW